MARAWSVTIAVGCVAAIAATAIGAGAQAGMRGAAAIFLVGAIIFRLRRDPTITRAPWALIAIGGSLALISAAVRVIHGTMVEETLPFPSPAEFPGYIGYIFIIAASRSFWKHRAVRSDTEAALDGFLVAAAATVIVFSAVLSDYVRDDLINPWARAGNVGYTVLDIILIGHVARLAVGPGVRNTSWRLIASATVLILANDLFFLLDTAGTSWALSVAGVTSPVAFTMAAAAILHPDAGELTTAPPYSSPRLTISRVAMLATALLTLPAALLAALIRDTSPDLLVLVIGSSTLAILSLLRISLLFRSKERIAELDAALSESGRQLLDASTATEIAVAVSRTIRLVVSESARYVAIVEGGGDVRHVVTRVSVSESAEILPLASDTISPDLHELLVVDPDAPNLARLEIGERGRFGTMLIELDKPLEDAHRLALQTMSAQIAQALASLRLAETRFARRAEKRLTALVEQSADLVSVVGDDGLTAFASPNAYRVLGLAPSEIVGTSPTELVHPDDEARFRALLSEPSKPDQTPIAMEARLRTESNEYRWFDVTTRDFSEDPEVGGTVITARDVTEERAAKLGLLRSEQWFRGLVQNSSDVIAVLDQEGMFTYVSPAVENLLGRRPEDLRGRNFLELLPREDPEGIVAVRRELAEMRTGSRTLELVLERADQTVRTTEVRITDLRGDPSVNGLVLNIRDISERKRLEEDLRHQVLHDDLTGLGSRIQFTAQLADALGPKRRAGSRVAALFVDVDDFKNINDSLGHAAGDQVLVEISSRLLGRLRLHDRAARFGGDEFAVLLTDVYGDSDVTKVADRIVEELSKPVSLLGHEVLLGVSIGIAIDEDGTQSPEDLLRAADVAMYEAKEQGKGRWAIFEASMADQTFERFEISNALGSAIENDELMVHYQPIVDLSTGHTLGVEALVRWNHPIRGMVSPSSFIPLAERNGLIVPLGRSVLRTAAAQVAAWRTEGHDIYASVNISPVQLQLDGIVDEVLQIVDDAGLDRGAVVLELTESALINDFDLIVSRIDELRDAGLRVAIDDFGTGYATLRYAAEFSADILKIDQTFVARLDEHDDSTIVSTVLQIADSMGAQTVAEGIELPDQHRRLLSLGCQVGQGYYFTRPAAAGVIGEALRRELDGEALAGHAH